MIEGRLLHRATVSVKLFLQTPFEQVFRRAPPSRRIAKFRKAGAHEVQRRGLSDEVIVRTRIELEVALDESPVIVNDPKPLEMKPVIERIDR